MTTKKKPNKQTKQPQTKQPAQEPKKPEEKRVFWDVEEVENEAFKNGKGYYVTADGKPEAFFEESSEAWAYAAQADIRSEIDKKLWLLEGESFRLERRMEIVDAAIKDLNMQSLKEHGIQLPKKD